MNSNLMTGPIILSNEDSIRLRKKIINPSDEYIEENERFFENLASSMTIRIDGTDSIVEFEDCDLSNLDKIISEEKVKSKTIPISFVFNDTSTSCNISYVNRQNRNTFIGGIEYIDNESRFPLTHYSCKKRREESELKDGNLVAAAS